MTRMRTTIAAVTIVALTGSAFAADTVSLAPGRPAGVKQAAASNSLLLTLGVAVVVAGAVGIAIASSNSATAPTAVTSTGTAP